MQAYESPHQHLLTRKEARELHHLCNLLAFLAKYLHTSLVESLWVHSPPLAAHVQAMISGYAKR
jgi:hypothetical protein